MSPEYLVWSAGTDVKHAACVKKILNYDDDDLLMEGEPLESTFPDDVKLMPYPDRPRDIALADRVSNTDNLLIVSGRVKEFLHARRLEKVEYLPVAFLDLKGKPVRQKYFILHALDHVDCLDAKKSGAKFDDGTVETLSRIVLDPKRIDPSRQLFRIANYWGADLVSRELADALTKAGFTGCEFTPLEEFEP